MASTIKGINVKIGADTTALSSALKDVNKKSRKIGRELTKVNRALKFNPGNTELLAQKQDLLAERVEATKNKLDTLRKSQKDVDRQFKKGDLPEEKYRAFKREVITTENKLEHFTNQLEETKREASEFGRKMRAAADNMEKAGNKMKNVGQKLNTHVTLPLMAAFTGLTVGTRDFRKEISVLENNADSAGVSMEKMNKHMAQMNAVTGELDSNVEGLSSLLAAGFKDEQMTQVVNKLSGAVTKFPDTLKFENLSESLQETLGSGESVGQFDEMLSRFGINLEEFNEGLQEAKENGEELDYVLQTLAGTGLSEVYEQYRENNKELVESAEAYYDLRSSLADLGEELEPILTDLVEGATDVVDAFNDLSEEKQDMVLFGAAVAAALGPVLSIAGNLSITISTLTNAIASAGGLTAAVSGLASSFGPFLAGAAIIGGLTAIYKLTQDIREETDLLTTATNELTEAELKEKKALLETRIVRLGDLVERGGDEDSILGADMQVDVQKKRLKKYREELEKTKKALAELNKEETSTSTVSGSEDEKSSEVTDITTDADRLSELLRTYRRELDLIGREGMDKELRKIENAWKDARKEARKLGANDDEISIIDDIYAEKWLKKVEEYKRDELALEEQYQNEIALLRKEGLEKELEQLRQQEQAEIEAAEDKEDAIDEIRELYEIKRQQLREEYAEKEEKLRQEQIEKEKKAREELIEWKYQNGFISLEYYRNYLQDRLKEYEMFSEKWKEIYAELNTLPEEEEQGPNLLKEMTYNGPGGGSSGGEDEGVKSLNWMTDAFVDLGIEIEDANRKFGEWKNELVDGLSEAIVQGESLSDVFESIADQMAAMVIKQGIVQPFVDWAFEGIGLDTGHQGGYISPAGLIKNLPSYHSGGLPGLDSDETIIKAQTGERVLSREQNKAFEAGEYEKQELLLQPIVNISATDSQDVYRALLKDGVLEKAFVRAYYNNGPIRKTIKGGN